METIIILEKIIKRGKKITNGRQRTADDKKQAVRDRLQRQSNIKYLW